MPEPWTHTTNEESRDTAGKRGLKIGEFEDVLNLE